MPVHGFPVARLRDLGQKHFGVVCPGRAVIASDLGSRRELVENGQTGLLYRVRDTDELAATIAFLHDKTEVAKQMGHSGRELVREKYSQQRHLFVLGNIYEQLAKARPTAARPPPNIHTLPLSETEKQKQPANLRIAYIGGRGVIGKYSGIETYYEEAGKRLAGMGHRVTAYCRSYFTPKINDHHGIQIVRLPTVRSKHLETFVHSFLSTVHACFGDHDIVHYHALGPSLFSLLPRLFGKKTVVTVQGLDWQRKKWCAGARAVLKLGEKASVVLPNKTIVVSRTLREYYGARYSNPTVYVPNGTEIRERRAGPNLERLALTPNGYVLFLGRFSPEKNCHLLIEAFENIETSVKLVLAGGFSHTNKYVTELCKHASEKIVFIDWLAGDALEEVLTNAALFVLPSDIEGLSLALLDAMGAGVCVLTSDAPENCEAVGDAGFTFKRGSVIDLRRMLDVLLGDETLRRSAVQIARARVQENYLWEKVVAEMNCVYADLMRPIPMKIRNGRQAA